MPTIFIFPSNVSGHFRELASVKCAAWFGVISLVHLPYMNDTILLFLPHRTDVIKHPTPTIKTNTVVAAPHGMRKIAVDEPSGRGMIVVGSGLTKKTPRRPTTISSHPTIRIIFSFVIILPRTFTVSGGELASRTEHGVVRSLSFIFGIGQRRKNGVASATIRMHPAIARATR